MNDNIAIVEIDNRRLRLSKPRQFQCGGFEQQSV